MCKGHWELPDPSPFSVSPKEEETSPQATALCDMLCDCLGDGTLAAANVAVEPQNMRRGCFDAALDPPADVVDDAFAGVGVAL